MNFSDHRFAYIGFIVGLVIKATAGRTGFEDGLKEGVQLEIRAGLDKSVSFLP